MPSPWGWTVAEHGPARPAHDPDALDLIWNQIPLPYVAGDESTRPDCERNGHYFQDVLRAEDTPWPPLMWLRARLQGDYSMRLYGGTGRLPTNLRVVWLRQLDNATLRALPPICACIPLPPWQPFMYPPSEYDVATDSLWIHHTGNAWQPAPHNSWVEVVRCVDTWRPLWFYVSPGSGVSVNVGKTLVQHHTGEWSGGDEYLGQKTHYNENQESENRGDDQHWYQHLRDQGYDSIQYVHHKEDRSPEVLYELVMLRWPDHLPAGEAPAMRCGRHPWLYNCDESSIGIRMQQTCAYGQRFVDERVRAHASVGVCGGEEWEAQQEQLWRERLLPVSPPAVRSIPPPAPLLAPAVPKVLPPSPGLPSPMATPMPKNVSKPPSLPRSHSISQPLFPPAASEAVDDEGLVFACGLAFNALVAVVVIARCCWSSRRRSMPHARAPNRFIELEDRAHDRA